MKSKFLLPYPLKKLGWLLFFPAFVLGILSIHQDYTLAFAGDYTDEIAGSFLTIALLFIVFSKEKTEDEYVEYLRAESLKIAVLVNYIILFFAIIFIYNEPFLFFMTYNMFTVLLFFIIHFHYTKWKHNNALRS